MAPLAPDGRAKGGLGLAAMSQAARRYCGRTISADEIERIRALIADHPSAPRVELSRLVCEMFQWLKPDGQLKAMSCRVAMLRMQRDGLITLPAPRRPNVNGCRSFAITSRSDPEFPIEAPVQAMGPLSLRCVGAAKDSSLWNELVERYHYLRYTPLPGAQLRYLATAGERLVAALGFGAAAWKTAPRDRFIGWTPEQRQSRLHLVVNNARFLILPWVRSKNLASALLALAVRRLPQDWQARYGYRPALLETFVDSERFRGTCYRAANWTHVGRSQGRGKLDRYHRHALPAKEIFLYPLAKDFRQTLCAPLP